MQVICRWRRTFGGKNFVEHVGIEGVVFGEEFMISRRLDELAVISNIMFLTSRLSWLEVTVLRVHLITRLSVCRV
jgi:hypothetical protein